MDSVMLVETAVKLDGIFLMSNDHRDTISKFDMDQRNVLRDSNNVPDLSKD